MSTHRSAFSRRLRTLCAVLTLLAPLLLAMRCANEDLTQRYELSLTQDATPEILGVMTPYTGRLALDLRVDGNPGDVIVRVQAQTSGDPDIDGCDAMTIGRERQVDATAWNGLSAPSGPSGSATEVSRLSVRSALNLPWDPLLGRYAGVIEAVGPQSLVRVYTSTEDVSIWDLRGNIVPPFEDTVPATCEGFFVTVYEMPAERVRVGITSEEAAVLFASTEDCTAQRVVQRICAGTSGPIEEFTHTIGTDGFVVDRIASLGVGDTVIIEGECQGACPATITAYAWVEPITCRTNSECSGGRACTPDGWCVKDPPPSCASYAPFSALLALALASMVWGRARRGRER